MPAFQKDWELTGNQDSLDTIVTAAHSLATRFDPRVKAVRSWDSLVNKRQNITNKETNFLVIIDSMCSKLLSPFAYSGLTSQTWTCSFMQATTPEIRR
jgi:hypothetical protein